MPAQYSADEVREMAESGVCEPSRLLHILGMISAGRPLYNSDREYLDRIASQLADKESALRRENRRIRRVLGAGPDRRAAGRPASSAPSRAEPAPVIDAPAGPPAAAGPRAAAAAAPPAPPPAATDTPPRQPGQQRRSAPPAPAHTPPASSGSPQTPAPASRGASTAAPPPQPAPAPAARHTLIDDASFDAILERRDRQQRSSARERAAEAIAAPPPPPPPPAQPDSPAAGAAPAPRGRLAGRLRGIVAGRR